MNMYVSALKGGLDYVPIVNQLLTFSPTMRFVSAPVTVNITILDDDSFEDNVEVFACTLSTNASLLDVRSATVRIIDDESECITFL